MLKVRIDEARWPEPPSVWALTTEELAKQLRASGYDIVGPVSILDGETQCTVKPPRTEERALAHSENGPGQGWWVEKV